VRKLARTSLQQQPHRCQLIRVDAPIAGRLNELEYFGWRTARHDAARAWQFAILRFAVTLHNADRLAALAIAAGIDGLGPKQEKQTNFRFFRKTSAELCAAIFRPNQLTSTILRQHLARIDDDRLQHLFAAAMEEVQEEAD
jgi:hypothetical protein